MRQTLRHRKKQKKCARSGDIRATHFFCTRNNYVIFHHTQNRLPRQTSGQEIILSPTLLWRKNAPTIEILRSAIPLHIPNPYLQRGKHHYNFRTLRFRPAAPSTDFFRQDKINLAHIPFIIQGERRQYDRDDAFFQAITIF